MYSLEMDMFAYVREYSEIITAVVGFLICVNQIWVSIPLRIGKIWVHFPVYIFI